eukprot:6952929-Prorocentrum_lima.AAC.1
MGAQVDDPSNHRQERAATRGLTAGRQLSDLSCGCQGADQPALPHPQRKGSAANSSGGALRA